MEHNLQIHTPILLPLYAHLLCLLFSCTSWFLHSSRPSSIAMGIELPPSWFKTMGSLASLRRLMGWQVPGLAPKLKYGVTSLANMRSGDFVFFVACAMARLVPPLSSFFLTLLEYYGLQLQHLSPNSITLVANFIYLSEMFMGGAAISAAVPTLHRNEGCEPAPTAHR
jgi:hypothetical protein